MKSSKEASKISLRCLTRATKTNALAFRVSGSATLTTKFNRDLTVLLPTEDLFGQGYLCELHTIQDKFSDLKFVPTLLASQCQKTNSSVQRALLTSYPLDTDCRLGHRCPQARC
jgi:hypothetical protein